VLSRAAPIRTDDPACGDLVARAIPYEDAEVCGAGRRSSPFAVPTAISRIVMVIRVVRLGSAREPDEGLRIGTVRRPPRGVPRSEFAAQNWYDVWLPVLAPSPETMKRGQAAETPAQWAAFARKYRSEMAAPDAAHAIELLSALSHRTNIAVGCYCEHEERCHRSILKALLQDHGAKLAEAGKRTRHGA
jgi:uncharacterized protein YeaO (DUF488 family)